MHTGNRDIPCSSVFIRSFVRDVHVRAGGLSKAEALQRAQLDLLQGDGTAKPVYAQRYYWAPFVLMGSPR